MADSGQVGRVESVNVGGRREVEWGGRVVETAIWKHPVGGRIPVRGGNVDGDDQADRRVHGGDDKAVYAYAAEDYQWWSETIGSELEPGTFGENLTLRDLDLANSLIGDLWEVGTCVLEVSQPRLPCYKLGIRMKDVDFPDRFQAAGRFGTYLRIIEEGEVGAGDEVAVVHRADHDLTITDLGKASPRPSPELVERILAVEDVPSSWAKWAERARRRQEA